VLIYCIDCRAVSLVPTTGAVLHDCPACTGELTARRITLEALLTCTQCGHATFGHFVLETAGACPVCDEANEYVLVDDAEL